MERVYAHWESWREMHDFYEESLHSQRQMMGDAWLLWRESMHTGKGEGRCMASVKRVCTHRDRWWEMLGFYEENLYTERQMMGDTWLHTRDDLKDLKFVRDFVLLVYEIKKIQKAPASSWEDRIKRAREDPLEREAEKICRIGKSQSMHVRQEAFSDGQCE